MKKIIVTGAGKPGYGQAITTMLLENEYHVIGTYEPEIEEKIKDLKHPNLDLIAVRHDKRKELAKIVERVDDNSISGLVNAQMYFNMENQDTFDYELWDKSLAVNITMPNFLFRELKRKFVNGASIVTITSTEGFTGSFGASAYAASKAFIHNLVKTHANLLGNQNIRSNAIAAGWIGGVMDTDEVFNMSRKITPIGRLGRPEEIAEIATFLLSEKSSLINGSTITADGGYSGVDAISKFEFDDYQIS